MLPPKPKKSKWSGKKGTSVLGKKWVFRRAEGKIKLAFCPLLPKT